MGGRSRAYPSRGRIQTTDFLQYMNNAVRVPQAYCYRCKFGYDDCSKCGLACAQFMEHTIENAVDGGVAGIFIEPIQGNGGMIDMPASYLKEVRRICDKHDIVLIFDEVQCAFGRVGRMFTSELHGVTPDINHLRQGSGRRISAGGARYLRKIL